ncbi:MAG TPA: extracellular solute-binding protein [Thiolinea sp.]|nr:extracellular solute-binding protein [Thiolinea sp.]
MKFHSILFLLVMTFAVLGMQAQDTITVPGAAAATEPAMPTETGTTAPVRVIEATSIALHGKPYYPPAFTHFDYVNPDAPPGGRVTEWVMGTFDNFNPYSQRGDAAAGSSSLFDDIMASSDDDLSAYYPLIAEKISYATDYSYIIFHVDPRARFQDGRPIRPEDIRFSFYKLTEEGLPGLKAAYSYVDTVEVLDAQRVRFDIKAGQREKDKIVYLCGLPVFPEHYWKDHRLDEPLKEVPVGSSGWRIGQFDYGKYVELERFGDYWARDLPVMKGLLNPDAVRYEYYRDETVAFEAFKAGKIDKWEENVAKRWATDYVFPAVKDGRVLKLEVPHRIPLAAQGFVFNTQRELFKDRRVREAMAYLMDFEWMNRNLFYDQYQRVNSYFMNTDYHASGLPSEAELSILEPVKDQVPAQVFNTEVSLPTTDGNGNIRANLRKALGLLKEAGWEVKDQRLVNAQTGRPFEFELLLVSPTMEKVALAFDKNLQKAGIRMAIRTVDTSQYFQRRNQHDYDMIVGSYGPYAYPSARTHQQWHSDSIDSGFNLANVNDKAIDYLMDEVMKYQEDEEKLLPLGKAIDRVLMAGYYMIPQWNISKFRIAHWDKFGKPEKTPRYALGDGAWWVDTARQQPSGP